MPAIRECLHWKSEPHPTLGDIPSKMVREAAQEAITAIFDTEKPLTNTSVPHTSVPQPAAVGNSYNSYSGPPPSLGPPRYEGFGSSNSGGNFQGGLKGISGPKNFEEDRSILSYASAPPSANFGNGGLSKMTGFGNSSSNQGHGGFDGSKGIEVVKHVGAKAASILTAGSCVRYVILFLRTLHVRCLRCCDATPCFCRPLAAQEYSRKGFCWCKAIRRRLVRRGGHGLR